MPGLFQATLVIYKIQKTNIVHQKNKINNTAQLKIDANILRKTYKIGDNSVSHHAFFLHSFFPALLFINEDMHMK